MYSPCTAQLLKQAQEISPVPPRKQETRKQADLQKQTIKKRPSSTSCVPPKKKPAACIKAKSANKPKVELPLTRSEKNASKPSSPDFGTLYITLASKQSYIQIMDPETLKKKLLVSCSESMASNHQEVIQQLVHFCGSVNGLDKDAVIKQRDAFLQK